MTDQRVLIVSHGDPRHGPGGTEIFAHALFREYDRRPDVEAWFVAGVNHLHRERRPGTAFQRAPGAGPREFLLWCGHYDAFHHSQIDGLGVYPEFEELLRETRPDVVHFHHFLLIGLEALAVVRRVLPRARIVLTLHDYYLMCANDGTLRTVDGRLCGGPSVDACTGCRPDVTPIGVALKDRYARTFLRCVDAVIAPSAFLRDRLIAWGMAPEAVTVLRNGHDLGTPVPPRPLAEGEARGAFAVFGNQSPAKGTLVALEAARLLVRQGRRDFSLHLHGDALFQSDDFRRRLSELVEDLDGVAVRHGRYDRADLPRRMAAADWVVMPSVWYENAPLTIQEAFFHGRPVLCSDIGGMAEAVTDGRDGLHFAAGDPAALARVMARALDEPDLWATLAAARPPVRDIAACADAHLALYSDLGDTAAAAAE